MSEKLEFVECATSGGGNENGWFYRVTTKCPICGRRTSEIVKGKGPLSEFWPQIVQCKNKHKFGVVPYGWLEQQRIQLD
jgi:hypothetical protein